MSDLDAVLSDFQADLQRAEDLLELVKRFRAFAAGTVPDEVRCGEIAWPEAVSLAEAAPGLRTDLPVLSGSILLYVCGRFEHFAREVVIALADEMVAKSSTYLDLPENVRKVLFMQTLVVAQAPAKYGYDLADAERLIQGLGRNLDRVADTPDETGGTTLSIDSRILAITESNMNSRTLADVFKRVGVSDLWSELGKQAPLKSHIGESADGACRSNATSKLDALMKERNGIAHPTADTTFPDPDQVLGACQFLKILSRVLVDVVLVPRT